MRLVSVTAVLVLTGASGWLVAQQARPASPAVSSKAAVFDVVSIRPIQPYPPYPNFFVERNQLRGNHVTARLAVAFAYRVNGRQIVGGPGWIASEHYNIDARAGHILAPKDASGHLQESVAVMLRAVLADRFRLRVRQEMREFPVHALVRAREGFVPAETHVRRARVDCAGFEGKLAGATDDEKTALFADCFERTGGELNVRGRPMSRLAYQLGRHLDRTVVDETGLSGIFDVDLDWHHRQLPRGDERRTAERDAILDVLYELLGMKLVERKSMLPVVIIESIQRPTPN